MSRITRSRVDGLSDVNKVLGELPRHVGKATLVRFGKARLQPMKATAKANAPEDEGDLKESIDVGTKQGSPGQRRRRFEDKAAVEVYMGPTEKGYPQAVPQEMGSVNNPPAGYMRKAWDQHHQALLTNLAGDLGGAVDQAAKRLAKRRARKG